MVKGYKVAFILLGIKFYISNATRKWKMKIAKEILINNLEGGKEQNGKKNIIST